MAENFFKNLGNGIELFIYLTPCAKKDCIVGIVHREQKMYIKVSVTARPIDNQANKALVKLIASNFEITKSSVVITHGHTSRYKIVFISNVNCISDLIAKIAQVAQHNQHQYNF
jgi:uncharacterized protein (TIGR00251 family)